MHKKLVLRACHDRVDDGGDTGDVQVDIGARTGLTDPAGRRPVQFEQARLHVLLGRVDDRVRADGERPLQPRGNDVDDDDVLDPQGLVADRGTQTDRAGTEDDGLVAWLGVAAVDRVPGHCHRLVERRDVERQVVGNDRDAAAEHRLADQQQFRQGAGRTTVADDPVRIGHGVDHHVVAHREPLHLGTDLHHLAGRLVPEDRFALPRRYTADGNVVDV